MSEALKSLAGEAVLSHIRPGMKLGLGTGSTAEAFLRVLAPKVAEGLDIVGVPTSDRTLQIATKLRIPLTTLDEVKRLDVTIDGADEIDPKLRLIKGGGGALLKEKIVASSSDRMIVIADQSKSVETLGAYRLPIEVIPFGAQATIEKIAAIAKSLGMDGRYVIRERADAVPVVTDCRHFIVDAHFGHISDPDALASMLDGLPGVVEHGLFIDLADMALVASQDGVRTLGRPLSARAVQATG